MRITFVRVRNAFIVYIASIENRVDKWENTVNSIGSLADTFSGIKLPVLSKIILRIFKKNINRILCCEGLLLKRL